MLAAPQTLRLDTPAAINLHVNLVHRIPLPHGCISTFPRHPVYTFTPTCYSTLYLPVTTCPASCAAVTRLHVAPPPLLHPTIPLPKPCRDSVCSNSHTFCSAHCSGQASAAALLSVCYCRSRAGPVGLQGLGVESLGFSPWFWWQLGAPVFHMVMLQPLHPYSMPFW